MSLKNIIDPSFNKNNSSESNYTSSDNSSKIVKPMSIRNSKKAYSSKPKMLSQFGRANQMDFNETINLNGDNTTKAMRNKSMHQRLISPKNSKRYNNESWIHAYFDQSDNKLPTINDSVSTFKSVFSKNADLKEPELDSKSSNLFESKKNLEKSKGEDSSTRRISKFSDNYSINLNKDISHPPLSQFTRNNLLSQVKNKVNAIKRRIPTQGITRKLFSPIVQRNKMPIACTITGRIAQMRVRSPATLLNT